MSGLPFGAPSLDGGTVRLIAGALEGDDCAILRANGEMDVLATTDYVRGPKFALYERGLLNEYDIGYYLAVANLSDVAAMGGLPIGLLPVVRYPSNLSDEAFSDCIRGIADACRVSNTTCIGGDIGTAERIILSATALGMCEAGKSLRRSSAMVGDEVYVTGPVGRAGAAVLYFELLAANRIQTIGKSLEDDLLSAWRRPRARFDIGRVLVESGERAAAQDVSDGLKATVEELAEASEIAIVIDRSSVPVPDSVHAVAERLSVDPVALCLSASVDFELVFTLPRQAQSVGTRLVTEGSVRIGHCEERGPCRMVDDAGSSGPLPGVSWKHQGDDVVFTVLDGLK